MQRSLQHFSRAILLSVRLTVMDFSGLALLGEIVVLCGSLCRLACPRATVVCSFCRGVVVGISSKLSSLSFQDDFEYYLLEES